MSAQDDRSGAAILTEIADELEAINAIADDNHATVARLAVDLDEIACRAMESPGVPKWNTWEQHPAAR